VYRRAVFIYENKPIDSRSVYSIEKKLKSIYRLIILVSKEKVVCKDLVTDEFIEFAPSRIGDYLSFFAPLAFGKSEGNNIRSALDIAEQIGKLYNQLCMNRNNKLPDDQESITNFLLSLVCISFAKSILEDVEIKKFFDLAVSADEKDYNTLFDNFFQAISNGRIANVLYKNLPHFAISDYRENSLPDIDEASFDTSIRIICSDLKLVDSEILASLIYRITQDNETSGIYGHYTSYNNVLKVLSPLFIDKFEKRIEDNAGNIDELLKIRQEIIDLIFFDPTNGPGCFLSSAFNSVAGLITSIDELTDYKSKERIKLNQFIGLVDNRTSKNLSRLTLWVTYIQYLTNIESVTCVILKKVFNEITIVQGDQLEQEWNSVCENNGNVHVIGSPTFRGAKKLSSAEKRKMQKVYN
jgi:hypothetical protein